MPNAVRRNLPATAHMALLQLNEALATGDILHSNVRSRLNDAINDQFSDSNRYGYYIDHSGDGEDGDVIYCSSGDTFKAPYHISTDAAGKASTDIDFDSAKDVVPVTYYQEESDEEDADDHMAAMEAAELYRPGLVPLFERFVSKKERDSADAADFAGKGKSYPILKPEDVTAAARSLGRAGSGNLSMDAIKRRIVAIAKRKGWEKYLPKAWQADEDATAKEARVAKEAAAKVKRANRAVKVSEAKKTPGMTDCVGCEASGDCSDCDGSGTYMESAGAKEAKKTKDCPTCGGTGDCQTCSGTGKVKESAKAATAPLQLVESFGCEFLSPLKITEAARTNYPIKVISPGTGSTAHYPEKVLEAAAAHVKPGCLMFWNHASAAEEAARPEGDLNNLAAIITSNGRWMKDGPKGPGIYAEAKVMADYAQKVEERAPHIGVSIRAGGTPSGNTVNGKPELASIDYIESIDYVTKAGRGGMALAEAAKNAGLLEESQAVITAINDKGDGSMQLTEAGIKDLITESHKTFRESLKEDIASAIGAAVALKVSEGNKPLIERAVKGDAVALMERELSTVALPEAQKTLVRENVLRFPFPLTGEFLDQEKFVESVRAEHRRIAKAFAEATGGGHVFGMGPSTVELTEAQVKENERRVKADEQWLKEAENTFERIGLPADAAKRAASFERKAA